MAQSKKAVVSGLKFSYPALVVGVLWGTVYPITGLELKSYSAYDLALARNILAMLTIAGISGLSLGNIQLKMKHFKTVLLLSLMGMVAWSILLNLGVEYSSPNEASFLIATYPLLTATIASILLREPLDKSKVIGLVLGLTGAFLIFNEGMQAASGHVLGQIAALCASLSFSLYLVLSRKLFVATEVDPQYVTFNSYLFSVPILYVLSYPFHVSASALTLSSILGLIWLGCVASGCSFVLLNRALLHAPAASVTSSLMIFPFMTVITTFILLGQLPTIAQIIGAFLVAVGVGIAQIH
jgi:drug/metabolite transporter (DMT)-like permease